ncbi:MAG: hypothetical protein KA746_02885 [Pyrinomonadaceae bacterium]|nr:hypothetical protein [Pyrinomonadaceae bacterium]MBP6212936.1 hypothetical protein [Pyrinomonadaceae bacterium]
MSEIRRQATLFLYGKEPVDLIRETYNPVQANLIGSHVTLCREDEVADWEAFGRKLVSKSLESVTLHFGKPLRKGELVYLPCIGPTDDFDRLRATLLSDSTVPPRKHDPHITLVHPRNGVCSSGDFEEMSAAIEPFTYIFDEVSFIAQIGSGGWEVIETFRLAGVEKTNDT